MKKLIFILFTVCSFHAMGQHFLVGIRGGVNSTNIRPDDFLKTENRTGFSFGSTFDFSFTEHLMFGTGLMYDQRGFTISSIFTDEYGNPTGQKIKVRFNYDYLAVPLKSTVIFGRKLYGFASLGIVPAVIISAKTKIPGYTLDEHGITVDAASIDVTKHVTKVDIAGLIEVGGGYKFKEKYLVYSSIALQHSLNTYSNKDFFSSFQLRHYGMNVSLGLKYKLAYKLK